MRTSVRLVPLNGPCPQGKPVAINGKIYFGSQALQDDSNLWIADANGSRPIPVQPGLDCSFPDDFVEFRGAIYFSAHDNTFGRQLWRLAGTTVERITAGKPGDSFAPQFPTLFNGALYFRGRTDDLAFAFWRFDGANLRRIGSAGVYSRLVPFKGFLYFGGWTENYGHELYRSDGQSVELAFEIAPGRDQQSWPSMLGEYRGWLYFSACASGDWLGGTSDRLLFRTDGHIVETVAGPTPVEDSPCLSALGKLYFWEAEHRTRHLCEFDGKICCRIATVASGEMTGPIVISDAVYFVNSDPSRGSEQRNCVIRYSEGICETIVHVALKGWSIDCLVGANGFGFLRAWDSNAFRLWRIEPSQ